jgi:hypothetical protein
MRAEWGGGMETQRHLTRNQVKSEESSDSSRDTG